MPKTIEEIAAATGFSITTIRLIINGQAERYRISAATRKVVEDYVAEHGYALNYAARALKLRRSDAVALVVPDLSNAFFARLTAELELLCSERGLVLLTASTYDDPEREAHTIDSLLARGVDGLVIAPCTEPVHKALFGKSARDRKVVLVDRDYGQQRYPTVVSDNFNAARDLARWLFAHARRTADFLCAHHELPSIRARIAGYGAACAEADIKAERHIHTHAGADVEAGSRLMGRLIEQRGALPDAFMCSSLLVLEGALQEIKSRVGQVPPHIAIGTFDNHPMLDFLPNRIVSVRQDEAALAACVVDRLLSQLAGDVVPASCDMVPCELVVRNAQHQSVAV